MQLTSWGAWTQDHRDDAIECWRRQHRATRPGVSGAQVFDVPGTELRLGIFERQEAGTWGQWLPAGQRWPGEGAWAPPGRLGRVARLARRWKRWWRKTRNRHLRREARSRCI